jgi:flagellar hook-associated protein 3 FlgL
MRITSEVMVHRSIDRLHTRLQRYERAQSELSTGRQLLRPSDDPAGARRALSLRSALQAREQELRNVSDAMGWLESADSQLQAVLDRLARVRELTTRAASSAGASERQALALEITQIAEELVGIANARHLGRPLFGGFADGDAVELIDGSWVARGGGDEIRRRVSDTEHVTVNVTAHDWLGFDDPDGDTLTFLATLAEQVREGDPAQIAAGLGRVVQASDRVAASLGAIGAATNRVESARARAEDLSLTLRTELSSVEDLDMARGVMELQIQQVAYEATLSALGKALPPSLVAFLR